MNGVDSKLSAQIIAIDVVSQLLATTEPQKLGENLTDQLRELTGARTVMLLTHCAESHQHELLYVSPVRRSALFTTDELTSFCYAVSPDDLPPLTEAMPDHHPLKALLLRAGITSIVRYPLRAGRELIGALLLFDLPGIDRMAETHQIMHLLAPPIALTVRNALAFRHIERQAEELERRVAERTSELQQKYVELQRAEELHRTILQTAMEGFWLVDTDYRIIEVNNAYCDMSGYSRQELVGTHVSQLDARDGQEEVDTRGGRLRELGADRFESVHRRKDGTELLVEVSINILPYETSHYAVFIRDITERRQTEEQKNRLEQQLQQSQRLESIGRLAGGVAHDFNNMLTIILGRAEVARMRLAPDHKVCADLREIVQAATKSADLSKQLLAFARRQTVEPKILDLNAIIDAMLMMLKRLIGENIQLDWHPAPGLWPIFMDPSQIDQIVANLCVNGRDAIEETGRITIETDNRTIGNDYSALHLDAAPGDYVCLSVSDNGKGMDKDVLLHIFEPFFTTKETTMGTGLGLATVYGSVRQNNGFINVYSEPHQGTTFSLFIPRHHPKVSQISPEPKQAAVERGHETILLVEDEMAILQVTAVLLENQGYTVLKANTPGEALKVAREYGGEIDLLMTDVIMPEMNGRELAKNILSVYPRIKRLYMSGYTADVIAHHGVLEEGMNFIQKPFNLTTLTGKVRSVLDG